MPEDFIITGKISRVIRSKFPTSKYVVLITEITCMNNSIEEAWIPFDSKRLSTLFFQLSGEIMSIQVEGIRTPTGGFKFKRIVDILDDELGRYESDITYLKNILTKNKVHGDIKEQDIYFVIHDELIHRYSMGIIYKVEKDELKMYINGGSDWWTFEELGRLKHIYRVNDLNTFIELANFTDDADNLLEIYDGLTKQHS